MSDPDARDTTTPATPATVTLEWRGRDLALRAPPELAALDDATLVRALVGPRAAALLGARMRRDRRSRALRIPPIDFAEVKAALLAHGAWRVAVAFDERPALPFAPQPTLEP
ncbi:MAG: hypothetical protein KGO05_14015, partial [Chloroflexota bacterium]|nr:hypothetical protein [Chloroflexota bacterium]